MVVVDIPPPSYSQEVIASQPLQVEENEQYNGNALPLHQEVTIENDLELHEEAALKRSKRVRKPTISNNYVAYLQEYDFDICIVKDPVTFSQSMKSDNSSKLVDTMNDKLK